MALRTSRRWRSVWIVVVGLGVYVVLAAAFNRFVEPAVAKRPVASAVAEQTPAATLGTALAMRAAQRAADLTPSGRLDLPTHFAAKPRPAPPPPVRAAAAPTTDGNSPVAEPKKPARRQATQTSPRNERGWNGSWSPWNFASSPSGGSGRWF
jgi:hypothetical protein